MPGGTQIEKVNYQFSISKSKKTVINTANVIQFPVKLAFASTAHKIQGATIPKPKKVIVNVDDTFKAAMVYVMLSRVCSLDQIIILNEFDEKKMYPNPKALTELNRLDKISHNKNPTKWEKVNNELIKVSSLNCRSLNKHYQDIVTDDILLKSDFIGLQETWLTSDESRETLEIPGYNLHINSMGKGKGIASYYKRELFTPIIDIKKEFMQISKFSSATLDITVLYRSRQGDMKKLNEYLNQIKTEDKPQLILGDFNFCHMDKNFNATKSFLEKEKFKQLIIEPTHIEGNLLDQAYLRDTDRTLEVEAETHSKYYTDHKGLALIIKKGNYQCLSVTGDKLPFSIGKR